MALVRINTMIYQVVQYCYITASLYLFFALLQYFINLHCVKHCKSNHKQSTSTKAFSRSSIRHRRQYKTSSNIMACLSILTSFFVVAHIAIDYLVFSERYRSSTLALCMRHASSGVLYFIATTCVYLFLWIRQRVFYAHPILKHLANPCMIRFSWSVLVSICVSMVIFITIYLLPQFLPTNLFDEEENSPTFNTTEIYLQVTPSPPPLQEICSFKHKKQFVMVHFVVTILFLYFQIALQFLFIYPVLKHQQKEKTRNKKQKTTLPSNNSSNTIASSFRKSKVNPQRRNRLKAYVTRCFIMTLICCLSDFAAFGFSFYVQKNSRRDGKTYAPRTLEHTVANATVGSNGLYLNDSLLSEAVAVSLLTGLAYNCNMLINLLCLIFCYEDWQAVLLPCASTKRQSNCCIRQKLLTSSSGGSAEESATLAPRTPSVVDRCVKSI